MCRKITLSTQESIINSFGYGQNAVYNNSTYQSLSINDYAAAAYPSDLSKFRGPYIDGNLYSIDLDLVNNTWELKYNNTTAILSGTISNSKLVGQPVAGGAMIEFSSQGGAFGYRVVDGNGDGVTEFSVTFLDSIIYVVEEVNGVKTGKAYNNSSKL